MVNFDLNVFIIARDNYCKIGRVTPFNASRAPYDIGNRRCYHKQTPAGARTICYHAREIS